MPPGLGRISIDPDHVRFQTQTIVTANLGEGINSEFSRLLARHYGIDDTDPVVKKLFGEILYTSAYTGFEQLCSTGILPTRITEFRKIALAAIGAALSGGLAGVAVGGLDFRSILAGVIGAHGAVLTNLLTEYLLEPSGRHTIAGAIAAYPDEPMKVWIILQLRERPRTIRQLCEPLGYPQTRMRKLVNELHSDNVVGKVADATRPVLWELLVQE
jgi:hypothetical protein